MNGVPHVFNFSFTGVGEHINDVLKGKEDVQCFANFVGSLPK